MTIFCGVMCALVPFPALMILGSHGSSKIPTIIDWVIVGVPMLTLLISAFFTIRGYRLGNGSLCVRRLGWENRLDLSRLTSATVDPEALNRSLRLFGNGGFFCFAGWFRNSKLGVYRAFATDAKRAVVLRFANRTVVVTPDDPQKFVTAINSRVSAPL